jgi:PAS domain S-box-containing protein
VTLLRQQGHRLLEAADGSEGLAVVHAEHPDLVITDVLMPVMDGYEFGRQLRLDPATRDIPLVFYTAHYGEREARALALSIGVSDVLIKPAESGEVLAIVGRLLAGESGTAPPSDASPLTTEFGREHLRLLTDKLSATVGDLKTANARLRALINIGLEVASERDPDRRLERLSVGACDLFRATYISLGILHRKARTVERVATRGTDAPAWIKSGDDLSGILETVVTERRTLRGENPGGDPASLQLPPLHPEIQAFLAVPIASPARVHGWICLVGNEGRSFTEDDEFLVVALAGQVGRIYELEQGILERKQAESALRLERDRAQRYLDTAGVILLALDTAGRITLINAKGCALLGWTERELLGQDFLETCLPVRTRTVLREKFYAVIGGDLSLIETPVLTKSGPERLVEWSNTLVRDDAGHVIGTFSSGADITERTQAIAALRTAEERMRFAMEAAGVGIWDIDYLTGVVRWSETLEAHNGLEAGTFGGTFEAFIERIHPDDRDSVLETIAQAKTSGADFSFLCRSVRPDGAVRWLSHAGRIHIGAHGAPVRGVGISLDITERRTLEAQYQQAQKMEAVGRLAGGVAHDFNNMLTVILGYCELLLVDLEADDRRRSDIAEIQKAGASAAALTRQLLAFSRKEIIEPMLLDLNVVVGEMRAMLGRLIGEDVAVVLGLAPGPALVKADRGHLEQIVVNLVVNARDAMPGGGILTIETHNVNLDESQAKAQGCLKPGPYVALVVTDTGTGMTSEVRAQMFEPFFTTKEPGKGTGLGLATVHGIVTQTGGTISVFSQVGRGTSFKVYIPRAEATERVAEALPQAAGPRTGAQTVLVVEDDKGLREVARRLLEPQGYTVLLAANAAEALQLFERSVSIDVLLTDIVMPGASGPELTRQLMEQRPGLKVIYMSGYTEEAMGRHGVLDSGIAFLHKPFTSDAVGMKIREVLGTLPLLPRTEAL